MYQMGFLGAGKMAEALMTAALKTGVAGPKEVICSDVSADRLREVAGRLGVATAGGNRQVVEQSELVVLAFKPQNLAEATAGLAAVVRSEQIIVSILAGVRIARIREALPAKVVRVMPNTACLVGQMAAGLAAGPGVGPQDVGRVRHLLGGAGLIVEVSEEQLDAVTGLSGSGPAFVAYLIEAFQRAGVAAGLTEEAARVLTLQTFAGTARLLEERRMTPGELIALVSSPQGTTVAGRAVLETSDAAEVIGRTVLRATERSRELGR